EWLAKFRDLDALISRSDYQIVPLKFSAGKKRLFASWLATARSGLDANRAGVPWSQPILPMARSSDRAGAPRRTIDQGAPSCWLDRGRVWLARRVQARF